MRRNRFDAWVNDNKEIYEAIVAMVLITAMVQITMVLALASVLQAAPPPAGPDVPEAATLEITRRGNHVESLGTIQAGPEAAMASALAPPADDSDRWFITVVRTDDPKYEEACDRLVRDINTSDALKAWVSADDPASSWSHYQVRRVEDETQQDWLRSLRTELDKNGYPAVLIQPPRNGQYGRNSTIVGISYQYDGDAAKLSSWIGDIVKQYAAKVAAGGDMRASVTIRGHEAPPPFRGADEKVDPFQPRRVRTWPPAEPELKPLTLLQIQEVCPGAPASFIKSQLDAKVSDVASLELNWLAWQEENEPVNPRDRNPDNSQSSGLDSVTTVVLFVVCASLLYIAWKMGDKPKGIAAATTESGRRVTLPSGTTSVTG